MVTDLKLSTCLGDLHQCRLVEYSGGTAESFNWYHDLLVMLHMEIKK
jgi:hypothetical protein